MKKLLLILLCVGWWAEAEAQVFEPGDGPRRVWTDSFWLTIKSIFIHDEHAY